MTKRESFEQGSFVRVAAQTLASLVIFGILTLWVRERWALAAFHTGICLLGLVWSVRAMIRPDPIRLHVSLVPIATVILWGLIQLAADRTLYRWQTWNSVLDWTTNLVLFFLALQFFVIPAVRRQFLAWMIWFGFLVSVLSTVQMFTSGGKVFWIFPSGYQNFVLGPFVYQNQYAAFMELLIPVALFMAIQQAHRATLYSMMACVMFASVIAGASRAGSMLCVVEVVVVLLLARRTLHGSLLAKQVARILVLTVGLVWVVGWETVWNRLQKPEPYAGRREMLWASSDMFRERPIWGFGLGTWPTAYPRYAYFDDGTFVNQAHNDWAQWAVEGGVPVLGAMLAVFVLALRPAFQSLWGLGVLFVLLHAFVDYPLHQRPALAGSFFVLLGLLAARDIRNLGPSLGLPKTASENSWIEAAYDAERKAAS